MSAEWSTQTHQACEVLTLASQLLTEGPEHNDCTQHCGDRAGLLADLQAGSSCHLLSPERKGEGRVKGTGVGERQTKCI